MSFSGKGGSIVGWAWTELVTLVGSISLETMGYDTIGVSGIWVIRGGLGIGRVVPYLKCIFAMFRA